MATSKLRAPTAFGTLVSFFATAIAPVAVRAAPEARAAPAAAANGVDRGEWENAAPGAQVSKSAENSNQKNAARVADPADLARVRRLLEEAYGRAVDESDNDAVDQVKASPTDSVDRASTDAKTSSTEPMKQVAPPSPGVASQNLPTASEATVTGKTISVPKGEGTIRGMDESFSAQLSTGTANYTVPFSLPKARGDAQPSLGLSYSSAGGFGVAGVGWSVGVAFIARQTDRGTPKYDDRPSWHAEQDRFVFNGGQELVPICVVGSADCSRLIKASTALQRPAEVMPTWATGWQYFRPRVEGSFLRFFWSPNHRTWRVQSKSGVTMEFGVPLDGSGDDGSIEQNPEPRSTSNPEIYRWLLAREYDMFGDANPASGNPAPVNVVRYKYSKFGGVAAYLTDIYDTPPAQGAATAAVPTYAHHTRLLYEDRTDPTFSYRSGFRIDDTQRLVGVDVTSKPFVGTAAPRELVRRYHLAYDPSFHVSLLASVTVEGRCAETGKAQFTENASEGLPDTNCPTLPPMTFGYQHVEGRLPDASVASASLTGYEAFDERVRSLSKSPDHSLDESQTVLHDINADGLPDVLVTAAGLFGGKHGAFFNAGAGKAGEFSASTIAIQGVLGATANDIALANQNVVPLDVDGDAVVDLVHMPLVKSYAVYTPVKTNGQWAWQGRTITTANALSPKIDFGRDAAFTKVVDVDFDGLVDVVRTTGTELQTYLSLGRYPKGDGRFGKATRTGADTADISTEPISTCVPWSGTAVSFGEKDTELADMNGDGIVDIVRLRRGDIKYWPGRGNGFFGTGSRDGCAAGSFAQDRDIAMDQSPYYSDIQGDSLRIEDVNGDGLADLVQVRFQDIDVWLNVDGVGWTQRHTIGGTPASPSFANRVRLADIDGSGTADIVWGNAGDYRYIDLAGGKRPWILTRVENGLGKSTDLEYSTSVAEMLTAQNAGKAWSKGLPIVTQVVKKITVSDNLTVAGRPPSKDVTEYTYVEPLYDGLQREFRGFRRATARRVGDANSPAETTESVFLLGECVDETNDGVADCSPEGRYRDNPRDALKGLPYILERHDDAGVYSSTSTSKYHLRNLYTGPDGRHVRQAFIVAETSRLYDDAPFAPASSSTLGDVVSLEDVLDGASAAVIKDALPMRASAGAATTLKSYAVDAFGNTTATVDSGCTGGSSCGEFVEEVLTHESTPTLLTSPSGWLFRTSRESVRGTAAHAQPYNLTTHQYDVRGRVTLDTVNFMGTVELVRNQSDSAFFPPRSGGTADAVSVDLKSYVYDTLGNVVRESGVNQRCRDLAYDSEYAELPKTETAYSGGCPAAYPAPGAGPLLSKIDSYDRGFAVPTVIRDVTDQPTQVDYDGFGRVVRLFKPGTAAGLSPQPSVQVEYVLPPATSGAYSLIHTSTQDGADPTVSSFRETWAYVDGLGRTFVTLREAEPAAGSSAERWIASGLTDFDNKSALRFKYLDHFHSGSRASYNFSSPPTTARASETYDAFRRPLLERDYDGTRTLQNAYHALSIDRSDGEDIAVGDPNAGDHRGTFFTELVDGHGRLVKTTERAKINGVLDQRVTLVQFLPTGETETIRRIRQSNGEETNRYFVYDTRGRLVLNVEPNSSLSYSFKSQPNKNGTNQADYGAVRAWRYRYNDAGDMVGMSDARGCGANYFYDGVGRLTSEDYFPCVALQQAPYSRPTFTGGLPTSGVEIVYEYDALSTASVPTGWNPTAAFLKGRLVRVRDQASHSLFRYDGRGRITETALRVATPGPTADNTLANRYAPRWYRQTQTFDADDRPVTKSTGATVSQLLGTGSASTITTRYNARGVISSVGSSYGDLITRIDRDADGFMRLVQYGDAAQTATQYDPDGRRRVSQVVTARAPLTGWPPETAPPTSFQMSLEHQVFQYDNVSNPTKIQDLRIPSEWPAGAKPADRTMQYDDLYRVTKLSYTYHPTPSSTALDSWQSPFDDELNAYTSNPVDPQSQIDARRALPSPQVTFPTRIAQQTWNYDWKGNGSSTDDDLHAFYDRSLGTITNGANNAGAYQLQRATVASGTRRGALRAEYDAAGNMTALFVQRNGPCRPLLPGCAQAYRYEWDEVGRLARARRWDALAINVDIPPSELLPPAVDMRYRYDGDDNRVIKTSTDLLIRQRHTLYLFDTLEIRRAAFTGLLTAADYSLTSQTEVPYLFANGVRLARVVWQPDAGTLQTSPSSQHVFLELGDHLGSTSTVLDRATGELVEKSSYQAYGETESDYRPGRWNEFREDYQFTGKEEDVEVGLVYFGKRFYSPVLSRWLNPDPLALHSPREGDLNLYAYVRGMPLKDTDPMGLDGFGCSSEPDTRSPEQRFVDTQKKGGWFTSGLEDKVVGRLVEGVKSVSKGNTSLAEKFYNYYSGHTIEFGTIKTNGRAMETSYQSDTVIDKQYKAKVEADWSTHQLGAMMLHELAHGVDTVNTQDISAAEGRGYAVQYHFMKASGEDVGKLFGYAAGPGGGDINIAGGGLGASGGEVRFWQTFIETYATLNQLQAAADGKKSVLTGVSKEDAQRMIVEFVGVRRTEWSKQMKEAEATVQKNMSTVAKGSPEITYLQSKVNDPNRK